MATHFKIFAYVTNVCEFLTRIVDDAMKNLKLHVMSPCFKEYLSLFSVYRRYFSVSVQHFVI